METPENNELYYALNLHLPKKKKRNSSKLDLASGQHSSNMVSGLLSTDTEEDYTYISLLKRVQTLIREENPELNGCPTRTSLQPPKVLREGTRKTIFANFMDFCSQIHRDPTHVMTFILEELSVNGSLDGTKRLIIRGRYPPSAIESVARKYVMSYVLCSACKGIDTIITKDKTSRLIFLSCNRCRASQTVQ